MVEYTTVIDLAKDVKSKINEYNETEPSSKKQAYKDLQQYVNEILSVPQNCSLIYKGDKTAVVFSKTLGKWRMDIWKNLTER